MIFREIIETALFFIVLILTVNILHYFRVGFNLFYVVAGLLVLWTAVKLSLKRQKDKHKIRQ